MPSFFLGFILSKFSARCGRRKLMIAGLSMATLCTVGLGVLSFVADNTFFLVFSLIFRFVQGIGCIMMRIMSTPLAAINFPKALNSIFIIMVFVISIGIFLAPLWGSLFITAGYHWPYFSFALVLSFIGYPLFLLGLPKDTHLIQMGEGSQSNVANNQGNAAEIPSNLPEYGPDVQLNDQIANHVITSDKTQTKLSTSPSLVDDRHQERKLKFCKICFLSRILSTVLAFFVVIYSQIYFAPILAPRFEDLGIEQSHLGLYFGIRPAAQLLATALCIFLLRIIRRPPLIFMALILMIAGVMLFGPSRVLHFPESIESVSVGFFLLGLGNGFAMMPILPEMIHYLVSRRILSRNKASDIIASLCDLVGGWGDIGAPLVGSLLDSYLGFRFTTDVTLMFVVLATIAFGVWGDGAASLCSMCQKKENKDYGGDGAGSQRNLMSGRVKADSVVITKMHMQRKRKLKLEELQEK